MTDENLNSGEQVTLSPEAEAMLPVSKVNELVGSARVKGRESAAREIENLRQEIESLKSQPQTSSSGIGGMPGVDMNHVYEEVHGRLQKELQAQQEAQQHAAMEKEAQEIAGQFVNKMGAGKEHFEDFDEVMKDFSPGAFPQVVYLATQVENTPQVMYELAKNPHKLATLDYLVNKDPRAAQAMIAKLSKSIQTNSEAVANAQVSPDPLDRLKPSTVGTASGSKTIRDLRRMPHLRG